MRMEEWLREDINRWLNQLKSEKEELEEQIRLSERQVRFRKKQLDLVSMAMKKLKLSQEDAFFETTYNKHETTLKKAESDFEATKEKNQHKIDYLTSLVEQTEAYLGK